MRIIKRSPLLDFAKDYPAAYEPMDRWYRMMLRSSFESFDALRQHFPSADQVGSCTIFNIGGNKYRLIVWIDYPRQICFVRHVLTHAQYDERKWIDECES